MDCFASLAMTVQVICPSGCFPQPVSSPISKNISALQKQKSSYIPPRPVPPRGVAQRHQRGAGCGGREVRQRRGREYCGRRSRVVLAPRRWRQVSRKSFLRGDGDKQARSPGRARRKPLKPSACGNAGSFRCIRGDYARVVFSLIPREAAGALRARHSPRPFRGRENTGKPRAKTRRENAKVCLSRQLRAQRTPSRSRPHRRRYAVGNWRRNSSLK